MKNQSNPKEHKKQNSGTAKEKATFDQNGKGSAPKYGQAGSTPNESADDKGPGTTNKNRNQ